MWIIRENGGVGCSGAAIPDDADAIDAEDLYEAHVASCPSCGKRVPENLTGELGTMLRSITFGMFGPLAVTEALVTCALGLAIVPVAPSHALFVLVGSLGIVAAFITGQLVLLGTLVRRVALPVISPTFFRSPVVEILSRERRTTLAAFIVRYLEFAYRASRMTFLTYASAAVLVALIFHSLLAGSAVAMSGVAWAISFRARLAVVQPIELLDVDSDEREELYRLQAEHSRAYRFLSQTRILDTAQIVHITMIVCVSGVALLGHLPQGAAGPRGAGFLALFGAALALSVFWNWSTRHMRGELECRLIPVNR